MNQLPFRFAWKALRRLGFWLICSGVALRAEMPREYQVKAAFLYNFAKFVEWPTPRPDGDPIVIGLLDENPFDDQLEKIVAGRRVAGHLLVVRDVSTLEQVLKVDLLFVAAGADEHFTHLAPSLRTAPVLTVGETASFQRAGGIIRFLMDGDHARFAISTAANRPTGLHLSAQLLKLAVAAPETAP